MFYNCAALESAALPSGLRTIGEQAFGRCVSLRQIFIPESVGKIAKDAFEGCRALTLRGYEGTCAEEYARKRRLYFEPLD